MKKFAILALAALLVVAFTVPAAALENEFGGYWRTRFFNQGHFDGTDSDAKNLRRVDTRTRLYYTAKINDNLKLVNKFEMNAVWGENQNYEATRYYDAAGDEFVYGSGGSDLDDFGQETNFLTSSPSLSGDTGADGVQVAVKNSYADFNTGPVNWTVGIQPYALFRSFHIDTDASGMIARWKILDNFVLAGSWLKAFEANDTGQNNLDVDAYTLTGAFWFSENMSIKPSISYSTSSDASEYFAAADPAGGFIGLPGTAPIDIIGEGIDLTAIEDWSQVTYGLDFDASWDNFGIFATIYAQDGKLKTAGSDLDVSGWLLNVGGNVMLGPVDLHTEVIYTPGDDDSDDELEQIFSPLGSHYWAEIMGLGTFDNQASANSPGDVVSNLIAFNIGASMTPMDKLKIALDVWYAELEEDEFNGGEAELGTEIDLKVTYELVEGLNLDLVGAYLFAGDGTYDGSDDDDPYEFGAQLSLSF